MKLTNVTGKNNACNFWKHKLSTNKLKICNSTVLQKIAAFLNLRMANRYFFLKQLVHRGKTNYDKGVQPVGVYI